MDPAFRLVARGLIRLPDRALLERGTRYRDTGTRIRVVVALF